MGKGGDAPEEKRKYNAEAQRTLSFAERRTGNINKTKKI
jgi:hypothetical protein